MSHSSPSIPTVHVDILIVGAGPAGAGAATFLAHHGDVNVLMINKFGSTAETPRAHITNAATLECFRDIGIEDDMMTVAMHKDKMVHTRITDTFLGKEYARDYSWGNKPELKTLYETFSPSQLCDLPQTLLEPILLKEATLRGVTARFNTEFISFEQDVDGVTSLLKDLLTGTHYAVRSKYLLACDGGRSTIVEQLKIPLDVAPAGGLAVNIHFKGDLTPWMSTRMSNLTHILGGARPNPDWAAFGVLRAVKPWTEWLMGLITKPGCTVRPTDEMYMQRTRELIGDDCPPLEHLGTSHWRVRETIAEHYSVGHVHAAGDAVHRHPPVNGLGSNTSIQDSYNLAWKLAYVLKGYAGPQLLDTYSPERQPVGLGVVRRANVGFRDHKLLRDALGIHNFHLDEEGNARESQRALTELKESSPAGAKRRRLFAETLKCLDREFQAFGIEMNQFYETSPAVYADDEKEAPRRPNDLLLDHIPTTYPGSRLPHAWLGSIVPSPRISTHDLAGKGAFTLFTGIGGESWISTLDAVAKKLVPGKTIPVKGYRIGMGTEYVDMYGYWRDRCEVEEDGCVLVRPDRVVAWRAKTIKDTGDIEGKLEVVMRRILSL